MHILQGPTVSESQPAKSCSSSIIEQEHAHQATLLSFHKYSTHEEEEVLQLLPDSMVFAQDNVSRAAFKSEGKGKLIKFI